jgi:hypothetical protein
VSVWIARTHGLIHILGDSEVASTLPTHACTEWCIGSSYPDFPRIPLKGHGSHRAREMDPLGFEPRASSLQRRHSTTELWARPVSPGSSKVLGRPQSTNGDRRQRWAEATPQSRSLGGDPAADSPTATLLRLKPPCGAQIRPGNQASSGPHSGALTGGVCKEQGRIHRALLTRDYYRIQLHAGGFQPAIRTTIEFRRLAPPLGVASHCLDHCSPRVAQLIRGILTYRCPFLPPS